MQLQSCIRKESSHAKLADERVIDMFLQSSRTRRPSRPLLVCSVLSAQLWYFPQMCKPGAESALHLPTSHSSSRMPNSCQIAIITYASRSHVAALRNAVLPRFPLSRVEEAGASLEPSRGMNPLHFAKGQVRYKSPLLAFSGRFRRARACQQRRLGSPKTALAGIRGHRADDGAGVRRLATEFNGWRSRRQQGRLERHRTGASRF